MMQVYVPCKSKVASPPSSTVCSLLEVARHEALVACLVVALLSFDVQAAHLEDHPSPCLQIAEELAASPSPFLHIAEEPAAENSPPLLMALFVLALANLEGLLWASSAAPSASSAVPSASFSPFAVELASHLPLSVLSTRLPCSCSASVVLVLLHHLAPPYPLGPGAVQGFRHCGMEQIPCLPFHLHHAPGCQNYV